MKLRTILLAILLAIIIWVFLPYIFVHISNSLGLPKLTYLPLQVSGGLIVVGVLLNDLYLFLLFKSVGGGTPVPAEPTNKLIYKGPYKYTRNPMYIGHLLIFLGEFLFFGQLTLLLYLFLAGVGFNFLVIKWEEPQLKKRLGKEYEDYLEKVPRWFPKLQFTGL